MPGPRIEPRTTALQADVLITTLPHLYVRSLLFTEHGLFFQNDSSMDENGIAAAILPLATTFCRVSNILFNRQ